MSHIRRRSESSHYLLVDVWRERPGQISRAFWNVAVLYELVGRGPYIAVLIEPVEVATDRHSNLLAVGSTFVQFLELTKPLFNVRSFQRREASTASGKESMKLENGISIMVNSAGPQCSPEKGEKSVGMFR